MLTSYLLKLPCCQQHAKRGGTVDVVRDGWTKQADEM